MDDVDDQLSYGKVYGKDSWCVRKLAEVRNMSPPSAAEEAVDLT